MPNDQNDIILEGVNATDTRTASVLWSQLNNYIVQDHYLSSRKGKYAERNGVQLPFYNRLDMNFTQDFNFKSKNKTNTVRFAMDIFNF